MKKIVLLFIGILCMSCNLNKKEQKKTDTKKISLIEKSEDFDWLLGKWKRLNEEKGKETFENWTKIKETKYAGIGFTMQNGDTIKQEKILLIKKHKKWNLVVKVPEEAESITFKGVHYTKNEFTCENNDIDFPNRIRYWKNGNKISATVSGGEMKISFEFEKINN